VAKILLVEDDAMFAEGLIDALRKETHVVDHALSVQEGTGFIETYRYDVYVFDWDLPDGSGAKLCSELAAGGTTVPIIMLTARSEIESRVHGLDVGATDYICKPCYPEELSARIRALLRRAEPAATSEDIIQCGTLRLNRTSRTLQHNELPVHLSPTEFDILQALMEQQGRAMSSDSLVSRCARGLDSKLSRSSVKVYVSGVRKKLAAAGASTSIESAPDGYFVKP
jgi:DNA-binding response OmpR family regulator